MSNQTISLPAASLVGFLLETLLYGAYVVVFLEHMKILRRRRSGTWAFKYQSLTSLVLFITITMRTIVDMAQAVDAYTGPDDASTVITGFSRILNKLKIGLYSAEILNADLFLVYRVYVLWGHSLLMTLFPFLIWLVVLAFNIWGNITLLSNVPNTVGNSETTVVAKYPLIGTTILNIICTGLIAGRIWWIQRTSQPYRASQDVKKDPVSRAFVIIVESASIYVGWLIALVATEVVSSNVYFMIFAFISPIVGLVFSIIIVRSCADTALNNTYTESKIMSMHFRTNPRMQHTTQLETFQAGGNPDEDWEPSSRDSRKHGADVLQLQTTTTNTRNTSNTGEEDDQQDNYAGLDSKKYRGDGDLRV